jgi:hypothetical protein
MGYGLARLEVPRYGMSALANVELSQLQQEFCGWEVVVCVLVSEDPNFVRRHRICWVNLSTDSEDLYGDGLYLKSYPKNYGPTEVIMRAVLLG